MLPTHKRYDYSIISERPDYRGPHGKRLVSCINIEHDAFLISERHRLGSDET